jgi:quinol monooxygenase YgiN
VVKVFITYKLNDDVTREQYRQWSREIDQPMASRQPGVISYEIYEVTGSGTEDRPSFDIVEAIEAESREAWEAVNNQPEMKDAVEQFFKIAQRGSIQVIYGQQIEP